MSRGLTSAALAAVTGEVVLRTVAADLDFASGIVRVNGSPASITLGGQEYLGVGALGSITAVEENAELQSYSLTMSLAGIPRDIIGVALTDDYQGRRANVWEVLIDRDSGQLIADPVLLFRGRMDQLNVQLGESATVNMVVQNRLSDWEHPRLRYYTTEDQQRLHPGDTGFRFVGPTADKEITWPNRSFKT